LNLVSDLVRDLKPGRIWFAKSSQSESIFIGLGYSIKIHTQILIFWNSWNFWILNSEIFLKNVIKSSSGVEIETVGWSVFVWENSNSKIVKSCNLKSCGHSLGTIFVLRIFKILSVNGRVLASKIEKNGQKTRNFNVFWNSERSSCPKS
jgi:hypothetical protein